MNVTIGSLEKAYGGDKQAAKDAWKKIAMMGGFGDIAPAYQGGLDIGGLPDSLKSRIEAIANNSKGEESEAKTSAKKGDK